MNTRDVPIDHLWSTEMERVAKEGKVSKEERTQILARIEEIRVAEGHSHAAVAGMISVSASVWSQVRAGNYPGRADRIFCMARQWLAARELCNAAPAATYVPTSDGKRVIIACNHALRMPCIAQIMMPSGGGKTTALMHYAQRMGERCMFIQAGEALSGKRALIGEMARMLGIRITKTELFQEIYKHVRGRLATHYAGGAGVPMMVIVDEATTLLPASLNMLRNFHDDMACRLAVVLADTWRMDSELRCDARRGMKGGYEQLTSRFQAVHRVSPRDEVKLDDVKLIANSILKSLGHTGKLHAESYKFLRNIAQAGGRFHNVQARLHAVDAIAEHVNATPTFSVRELDYVASLVGAEMQMDHSGDPPFGQPPAAVPASPVRADKAAVA